jgi:hypothetical protein
VSRHSLLLLLFAACGGNGGVAIGGDCSQEDICEDGAVCDFTDPGGPICIDGGGDLDGDGLANNKDFCNHQAGGQFDEDGDGIGDDCDGCPISPPAGDDDDDGDGVVEPCDPDPREPGDQIVAFSGFNDGVLPENWMATSGWTFVNGEAVATSQSPVNNEVLVAPLPLTSRTVAVFSEYRIESLDPQATQNRAGVVAVDQRPAGGTDATCAGNRTAGMDSLVLDTTLNASNRTFPEDTDLFNTDLFRLTLVINNANAGCALKSGPLTGAVTAQTNGELSNQGGLTAKGVTARYQYLLVVQRGPVSQN